MNNARWFLSIFCLFLVSLIVHSQHRICLQGDWSFSIDSLDVGVEQAWFKRNFEESVHLPGSMQEQSKGNIPGLHTPWTGSLYDSSFYFNPSFEKYRQPGNVKFPFFLTPDRHYVGAAWYSKTIEVPKSWKNQAIRLHLERPHTYVRVWLNDKEVARDSSLSVPHVYDLSSNLKPGNHRLTLRIDNRLWAANVGQDSHSVTDQTQGNWNGVVGAMYVECLPHVRLASVQVFPQLSDRKARLDIRIQNEATKQRKRLLRYSAQAYNTDQPHQTVCIEKELIVPDTGLFIQTYLELGSEMQTWDEFHPALYRLNIELLDGKRVEAQQELTFGMREIEARGKWMYLNGRKIQLRGTVENCCFPLTGYPPTDVREWERIFRVAKSFGLNHMRFHSYCPPEAAFVAADLVGFYLQPEGPSWPNHGSSLGYGAPIDTYLMEETERMTEVYGNHPSFVLLAAGNEPRGRWVPWATRFVQQWKQRDSRRLYTGASVGGSWAWQPANEYHVKAGARGLDWNRMPESMSDFRARIDTVSVPFVSHETGQWCAFPRFEEIRKYTGVNKAKNFELFQEDLDDKDMGQLGHAFMMASGRLQTLAYKHEIEKTLRTPDYAGFQLLSLNDYSGQGTALVGVLDVYWEEKGYCSADDFRQFCGPVVPLLRVEKFVWQQHESMQAQAELSYFGPDSLANITAQWQLKDALGVVLQSGSWPTQQVVSGGNIPLGTIQMDWSFVHSAGTYRLELMIPEYHAHNAWDFHVYPSNPEMPSTGKIRIAYEWTDDLEQALMSGADVFLMAAGKIEYGKDVVQTLAPVFWNTSWFKMRPPHTTGILVNPKHPAFTDFPTDMHADLRWWELMQRTQVMQLTDFPKGFQPLIQSIDTWFLNRKIGMLLEAKVGKGRLLLTSMDLTTDTEQRPVARQMYISLIKYMQTHRFRPEFDVHPNQIKDLFQKEADRIGTFTQDAPDELKPELFNQ